MSRPAGLAVLLLGALVTGCASHAQPRVYDFDSIEPPPAPSPRLDARIIVPAIATPGWLRSTSLIYRLDYSPPSLPRAYASSEWRAPPADLLTWRLRQLLAAANTGFTLTRPTGLEGYRLDVTLEQLEQVFESPRSSRCRVTLRATVTAARGGRVLAQQTFHADKPAATADAAGGARGLVEVSDQCLQELLRWLQQTVQHAAS
jgi:cholesterol transport system auxiliary component